jgi:hypothetical protein
MEHDPFDTTNTIGIARVSTMAGGLEPQLDAPELAARVGQLSAVVRDFINGVETGAITSDHDETFNNLVRNARNVL